MLGNKYYENTTYGEEVPGQSGFSVPPSLLCAIGQSQMLME